MKDLSTHIYEENGVFYFDTESYTEGDSLGGVEYEDGDKIKWLWEGKRMLGTLREANSNLGLFKIEQAIVLK